MVVIPNGFDTAAFRPDEDARRDVRRELGIAPDVEVVGHVARFDPQKDHRGLIEAAASVCRDRPAAMFVLCGNGVTDDNAALKSWIDRAGIAARVLVLGRRSDLARLTNAFDVAVSSSAYGEGFSNAIGEAMACGVPCVATDDGDGRRIIADTGRVVPVRQPGQLAGAIHELLSLPAGERKELGRAARSRVEEHYTISAVARQYEDLYREVVGDVRLRRAA
jgi:glycosyltransferase involved in cell wall biosynthesis